MDRLCRGFVLVTSRCWYRHLDHRGHRRWHRVDKTLAHLTFNCSEIPSLRPRLPVRAHCVPSPLKHYSNMADIMTSLKPNFGICFDVDGVLARGTFALPQTYDAFRKLISNNKLKVPVCFVTNALNRNQDKADQIAKWLDIEISPDQMVQAQGPLELYTKYHDKHCLVIGQGKIPEIAKELGFTNISSLEDIADAYPLLDMVDHDNRKRVAQFGYEEKDFPKVEAIILLGEPKKWESSLQIIVDLLRTDGKPDKAPEAGPEEHLPVLACNMDLQFMDRACMPRYGHGAFLLCLEALYRKVTGREMKYTALVGKPSEITFRYAEHCLSREAKKMGIDEPIKTMYLVGDTPEVDIVGSNLYQQYVRGKRNSNEDNNNNPEESSNKGLEMELGISQSRSVPTTAALSKQTIEQVKSILVCTGVYEPNSSPEPGTEEANETTSHSHRDFPKKTELYKPTVIRDNIDEAVEYILSEEHLTVN